MEMTTIKSMPTVQTTASSASQTLEQSFDTASKSAASSSQETQFSSTQMDRGNSFSTQEQKEKLIESANKFNEMSESLNLDVKFAYNDKIDQVYLNVIDKNTGKIIRKLPSEEAMKISESMKDLVGALLDKKG